MNREQLIAWLTLEGYQFYPETDLWHPAVSNGSWAVPLHMEHEGYAWGPGHDQHSVGNMAEIDEGQLCMAARNLGVTYG